MKGAICAEFIAASTPINYADLEARGVLEAHGAWYVLLKPGGLPAQARRQVRAVQRARIDGRVVTSLSFRKSKKAAACSRR